MEEKNFELGACRADPRSFSFITTCITEDSFADFIFNTATGNLTKKS